MNSAANLHRWMFLTNHAMVYIHLFEHNKDTIRNLADHLGIGNRTVAYVLADLKRDGYVVSRKDGRQNSYQLNPDQRMRRPPYNRYTAREFFALLSTQDRLPDSAE